MFLNLFGFLDKTKILIFKFNDAFKCKRLLKIDFPKNPVPPVINIFAFLSFIIDVFNLDRINFKSSLQIFKILGFSGFTQISMAL